MQRDHLLLMQHLKRLLAADGTGVLQATSVTSRWIWPVSEAAGLKAQNITGKTRPKDFERNQHIHNCWIITHAERRRPDADPVSHRRLPPVATGPGAGGGGWPCRQYSPVRHPGGRAVVCGLPGACIPVLRDDAGCELGWPFTLAQLKGWLARQGD